MPHLPTVLFAVATIAGGAFAPPGAAQRPAAPPSHGPTFGVGIGLSRISLRALPTLPAVHGTDVAIGWHAGWQTGSRVALLLAGTSSVYRYPGGGRARKRGFETHTPTIEYRVADGVRLQAGAGLQLDAPVFWDVHGSEPAERKFSRGLGRVLGASYAPRHGRAVPELRARWNAGYADVPEGRVRGQASALLVGVRHDP